MSDISHVLRTVDDLAKRVAHLEEENKQLKRQLRPSTAGADFMDMSLIRGMALGDHLNRRRRFAVTSYEKGAALEI